MPVSEAQMTEILKSFGVTRNDFDNSMEALSKWFRASGKFAKTTENRLGFFLLNSKMDVEKAKKNFENYHMTRASLPDFYRQLIPGTDFFEKAISYGKFVRMDTLTPDHDAVLIFKIDDVDGDAPDAFHYYVSTAMIIELTIEEHSASNMAVVDLSGFSLKCLFKYTPTVNIKLIKVLLAINYRLRQIHILNAPGFIDKILSMSQLLLPTKTFSRIKIHKSAEDILQYIDKNCLPSNYGGNQATFEELYGKWIEEIRKNQDFFVAAAKEICYSTESEDGEQMTGTFKKLSVD